MQFHFLVETFHENKNLKKQIKILCQQKLLLTLHSQNTKDFLVNLCAASLFVG